MTAARPKIVDVVVAVRNEEKNLASFAEGLLGLRLPEGIRLSILFVEDTSSDGTLPELRRLARVRPEVRYVSLTRGFGQAAALVLGLKCSTADASIMMDADHSHPPEVVQRMMEAYAEGIDIAQGFRQQMANRSALRHLASLAFPFAVRVLTGVDLTAQNVYFRLVSRPVRDLILTTPRWWAFLRLPSLPAFQFREIAFQSRERLYGRSNYTIKKLILFALDGILSLISPLRLWILGAVGVILVTLASAFGSWAVVVVVAVASAFLTIRYLKVSRNRVLDKMQVKEANFTLPPGIVFLRGSP